MKHFGNINLQQNFIQEASFEVESNFPAIPVIGRIVFNNKKLYICVDIANGTPAWVAMTQQIETYVYEQDSSISDTWIITHNLYTTSPTVQVYGPDHKMVMPSDVEVINNNTIKVTFGAPTMGRAIVMTGETVLGERYSYEFNQTSPSATWTVNHDLGYQPVVRVFIGNAEVLPQSIVHDTLFTCTITFTSPQVGVARLS